MPMKRLRRTAIALVSTVALAATYLGLQYLTGNVHEVIAGEFYRSGQLSGERFADVINRYDIKTIVNLRGASQRQWYNDEVSTAARLGVHHIDFKMSALKELTTPEITHLLELMRSAPKPLLIHCEGGADRSGLASVLYLQQVAGVNEDIAELQLSPFFGHFGIAWLNGAHAMDESWERFEQEKNIEPAGVL